MNDDDPLLDLLLKSARPETVPDDSLPLGFATRVAARWALGDEPETLMVRLWERFAFRAALVHCAAALMVGWALHGSLLESRRAAREGSAQEIELVQIEEFFWTP